MKYLYLIFLSSCLSTFSQETVEKSSLSSENIESLEDVKQRVKESIDAHAYDEDSNKRKYKVIYEGDNVRFLIMKRNGSAPINKGLVFDFSTVYKFDKISKRRKDIAYVNVWTSRLRNKKRNNWAKHKLIMRVYGHDHAETIVKALKDYNKLLTAKK